MDSPPSETLLPAAEILRWIRDGFREYGPDRWLFLRELAQNSRDAGADKIEIRAFRNDLGRECLEFRDNGCGMTRQTARDYLFRFYASSKENTSRAAGRFGIGFWSVWRFGPVLLRIFSRHKNQSWAVEVDAEFHVEELPPARLESGTLIVLQRPAAFRNEASFQDAVKLGASRYCRHLMRCRPAHRILPVTVNGQLISRPLRPPGSFGHSFRNRRISGGAALGENPEIRIFSGGLPVWRGTSIAEITGDGERPSSPQISAHGLYPVIWMECPDIQVDLSRRHLLRDTRLTRLRRRGEREIMRLFSRILDQGGKRSLAGRIRDGLETMTFFLRGRTWLKAGLILMLLIPVEIFLLRHWLNPGNAATLEQLTRKEIRYTRTTVDDGVAGAAPDLIYSPGKNLYFRLFSAESFDSQRGFVYRPGVPETVKGIGRAEESIHVRLEITAAPDSLLPYPSGYEIDPSSLRWEGHPLRAELRGDSGARLIDLPPGSSGILSYSCFPAKQENLLNPEHRRRLQSLPPRKQWPAEIRELSEKVRNLSIAQRVTQVKDFVARKLTPQPAADTARRFLRLKAGDWTRRVLAIRRGDCDVINGFAVLLLRHVGIPARMGIGWVGTNGRLAPRLHAWIEYHHQSWHYLDLSIPPSAGPADSAKPAPLGSGPDAPPDWIPITGGLVSLITIAAIVWMRRRRRITRDPEKDAVLSRLVLGALLYPGRWGSRSSLWSSAVLPLMNGRRLSLRRALSRIQGKGLFCASPENPLAHRCRIILDSGSPHFRHLYRLIYGIVDLDPIAKAGIRAVMPNDREKDLLLDQLTVLGEKMKYRGWRVGITNKAEALPPQWIDISLLGRKLPRFWRRPVLAISLRHPAYIKAAGRASRHQKETILALIAESLTEAPVLFGHAFEVPSILARRVLKERP
ncbi:MAG: ATP-binding protein [Candidatus Aminicenantes bacterium]|nr:ATP-binding protein [Candidatus Aminicenantes bacterium]